MSSSEAVALLFLLLFLKLRHLGGNILHFRCGIVGQTVASEGVLDLLLIELAEDFVCAAYTVVVDYGIVVVLVEEVIATVLRR